MQLSEFLRYEQLVTGSLRIAAGTFEKGAAAARAAAANLDDANRLAEQFDRQATTARELADRLEEEGIQSAP